MRHVIESPIGGYQVAFAGPRNPIPASRLNGRVAILDLAFAFNKPSGVHPSVTHKLIHQLGDRLALYLDHHDSMFHEDFEHDPRFVLATKAQHGACPEMITPELVSRIGAVDTILCHDDFDGLASAAKWILGGREPYEGCDHDAWCVDTRLGTPSPRGLTFDRALRSAPKDALLREHILRLLVDDLDQPERWSYVEETSTLAREREERAEALASGYTLLSPSVAYLDVRSSTLEYDRTHLLLMGQRLAKIAVVLTSDQACFAASFDSGVNFLKLFGLSGGMPTVVSLPPHRLRGALTQLSVPREQLRGVADPQKPKRDLDR